MKQYRICDFEGLSVWVSDDYDFHFNVFISNIGCIVLVESDDFFFIIPVIPVTFWASLVAQLVRNLPTRQETWVQFLEQEDGIGYPL